MKIGITGAAGFLGASLVREISEQGRTGDTVVPFVSRRVGNPITDHFGCAPQHLDVTSREEVMEMTSGLDTLYHVAGVVSYARRDLRRTWDVNVKGTRNILDAARENRIPRVVCVSSISVLGVPAGDATEADETNDSYAPGRNPVSFHSSAEARAAVESSLRGDYSFSARIRVPYFDSKLAAYEDVRRAAAEDQLPVVLVLPGTAVGDGDTGYSIGGLVDRVYRGRLHLTLPGGTSFVSSRDVARGIRLSAEHGRPGEPYIISGTVADNLGYGAFMRRIAGVVSERFGRACFKDFRTVPAGAARVAAWLAESFAPGGELQLGLALSGCLTHRFSSRKAAEELGYRPAVSLDDAIAACIDFNLHSREEKAS
jgi:dihydroflavonol-4-reductase